MKKMKKLVAMLLTLAMVMGMTFTVSAAPVAGTDGKFGTQDDRGTITISGLAAGENLEKLEVLAHPIVKANYENSGSFSGYEAIYGADTVTIDPATGNITLTDAQMTALLAKVDATKAYEMDKNVDGTVFTEEVPVGTYLVQIKNAELKIYGNVVVSVRYINASGQTNIEEGAVNITENFAAGQPKVQPLPTLDKAIIEKDEEVNGNTVAIGDTVKYQITTKIPYYGGAYPKYRITDTLTGLSFVKKDGVIVKPVVTVAGEEKPLVENTHYKLTQDEDSFEIDFVVKNEYTLNKYQGKDLFVNYSAVVDNDAALNNNENTNDATLYYTKDSKVSGDEVPVNDKTYSYTFDIDAKGSGSLTNAIITKYGQTTTTEKAPLAGAEFTLYKNEACTEMYTNPKMEELYPAQNAGGVAGVIVSDEKGQLTMVGLDEGTYYLKETKAPSPYTLNNTVYKIVIDANVDTEGKLLSWTITVDDTVVFDNDETADKIEGIEENTFAVTVENEAEKVVVDKTETQINNTKVASLPSTGGIGTTVFTVAGCVIMIAAAYFFIVNRRREEA